MTTVRLNEHDLIDFSFSWPLNGAITWNATLPYHLNTIDFNEDVRFTLYVDCGGVEWTSPPLVAPIRSLEWGIGIGEKTSISGTDYFSFLASKNGTDMPVFQGKMSHEIINSLASAASVPVYNCPVYKIAEYKADKGKLIEHMARVFRDGGFGFKVTRGGIYGWPLKQVALSGYGQNWIKTFKRTRNATEKITAVKIVKTSPVQSRYEFTFETTGYKTVTFNTPLKSAIFRDISTYGYIDEVTYYNGENVASSGQIGQTTITMPHPGIVYPQGYAPGPIRSASLNVYPPMNFNTTEVMAIVAFDGVPQMDAWYDGIELAFESSYSTGETPERPSADYIDGTLMPTKAHADSIIQALYFDKNKGSNAVNLTCADPIMIFEPGDGIVIDGQTIRVETVNYSSKGGLSLDCVVIP